MEKVVEMFGYNHRQQLKLFILKTLRERKDRVDIREFATFGTNNIAQQVRLANRALQEAVEDLCDLGICEKTHDARITYIGLTK